jgi:hypothetical protein
VTRRYAEGTKVSVESSRGEISGILGKHGVVRMGWFTEPENDVVQFELGGRVYRLGIKRPNLADVKAVYSGNQPWNVDWASRVDAEWRRRWRATVLLLKAKLEFADGETSTVERELMAYMLLKDGQTLEAAISAGAMPLLAAGKSS